MEKFIKTTQYFVTNFGEKITQNSKVKFFATPEEAQIFINDYKHCDNVRNENHNYKIGVEYNYEPK